LKKIISFENISLKKYYVFGTAVVIVLILFIMSIFTDYGKFIRFKSYYSNDKYYKAVMVYEKFEDDSVYKLESEGYIINSLNNELDRYKNEKIDVYELENIITKVREFFDFPELAKYSDSVNKAIESENAYKAAVAAENESRYADAILLYRSVIMHNPDYETASKKISELEEKYKKYIEESFPVWREKNDYINALWEIGFARRVFEPGVYETEKNEFEMIKLVAEKEFTAQTQPVYSFNDRVSNQEGVGSLAVTQVQNNSDKVIKEYTVVFCAYDANSNRIAFSDKNSGGEIIKCHNKTAALKPGENTGSAFGWNITADGNRKIVKIESCVLNVVYEDGTKWENPYYKFWCDERDIVDYSK